MLNKIFGFGKSSDARQRQQIQATLEEFAKQLDTSQPQLAAATRLIAQAKRDLDAALGDKEKNAHGVDIDDLAEAVCNEAQSIIQRLATHNRALPKAIASPTSKGFVEHKQTQELLLLQIRQAYAVLDLSLIHI